MHTFCVVSIQGSLSTSAPSASHLIKAEECASLLKRYLEAWGQKSFYFMFANEAPGSRGSASDDKSLSRD